MIKNFKLFYFIIFFIYIKNNANNYDFLKKQNIELTTYVANLLYYSYQRSHQTILFWENLNNYLIELNQSIKFTLNRMRNPSKNLNENINFFKKNELEDLFLKTNSTYDLYANILNNAYDKYLIHTDELIFIEKIRLNARNHSLESIDSILRLANDIKNSLLNIDDNDINRGMLSKINESIQFISEKLKIKELAYSYYIETDRIICNIYHKYINIEDIIYDKYKKYYSIIEKSRENFYKNEYNKFMNIFCENNDCKLKKIIKVNNFEIICSEDEFLPIHIK